MKKNFLTGIISFFALILFFSAYLPKSYAVKVGDPCNKDEVCDKTDPKFPQVSCRKPKPNLDVHVCLPLGMVGDACDNSGDCATESDSTKLDCKENKLLGKICVYPGEEDVPQPPPPEPPCAKPLTEDGKCPQFFTALGDFSTSPGQFIASVFAVLLAASGAIALLLLMRAGYKIMMSRGNPEVVKEGRDQLIAAIVGLLFLIFALVFLELIGVDILKIPDLDKTNYAPPGGNIPAKCASPNRCTPSSTCASSSFETLECGSGEVCCRP